MSKHHSIELPSHDFLSTLARTDPKGYELLRSKLIKELIDRSPESMKSRLRGMQFRIDCERQLSHSALGMTVKLYELMWGSFLNLNDRLQDFIAPETESLTSQRSKPGSGAVVPPLSEQCAQVLEFRPRDER
ncbi:DUF3135 domain-containing protein [Georgfuchsia toluolica]|uniref:DUF3135 domain-containing protein n=1 Tax=Georgfuchsia toluolica TaxID=424218 RepID=UPI001C7309D4|nr:DUF3135 domain-containing protein [Georgfuchsia toluolica]